MIKAIFQKEWYKTRMAFFVSLALCVVMAVYALLRINRLIEIKGVEHLWMIMLLKDNTFIDLIKYTPLCAGALIGFAQMAPEMVQKRLKLTLHLPFPQMRMIGLMLCAGAVMLIAIFAIQAAIIAIYYNSLLPGALVSRVMLTSLPWYFAGFIAYLFASAMCLEGTWRRRMVLALLAVAALLICFLQPAPEAYNGMAAMLLVFTILLVLLAIGSVLRFKEGLQ